MEEFLNKEFFEWVEWAADKIRSFEGGSITVVHHNDADGICSAAILSKLCEYCGFDTKFICIEKVHPSIIERIHGSRDGVIIYTDLAGLAAEMIDRINAGRCHVFIIDHHPAIPVESESVFVLAPELAGISGDIFISASTLNYIFYRILAGEKAKDYAYLAVLGSVGDYHDRSGGILGFDRFALDEATDTDQIKVKIEAARERYYVKFFDDFADVIAGRLTTLGAIGYEEKGYKLGLKACFNGFDQKTLKEVEKFEKMRTEKFEKAIEILKSGGLKKEKYCQWFHIGDFFSPMGVKTVGEFCEQIKDMTFVDDDKYVIGFQNMPRVIPDLGEIDWNVAKMSGRVPPPLHRMVLRGDMPGLDYLVPTASEAVGGFADATHKLAAATVVEGGKEEAFVKVFDRLVSEKLAERGG